MPSTRRKMVKGTICHFANFMLGLLVEVLKICPRLTAATRGEC
jgi:hypothetical protein